MGYFGIAIYQPRHAQNVGTLWRTAMTYGAAFVATIGRTYQHQASDTCKTPLSVPMFQYADLDGLIEHLPYSCPLVGVELDPCATSADRFRHPDRAVYLLGAEDHGLPAAARDRCHRLVQIPTPRAIPLNVGVAGGIIMHLRAAQQRRDEQPSGIADRYRPGTLVTAGSSPGAKA